LCVKHQIKTAVAVGCVLMLYCLEISLFLQVQFIYSSD
jgi:hypothetical protein